MDHLSDLMRQGERTEVHDSPGSTAPRPAPDVPVMPSMREGHAQQPLLQALPPPALPQMGQSTVPALIVGMKRSATNADLEADAVPDGKRLKVSHATAPDADRLKEVPPETPDPGIGRKRNALDAGLDEDDLPPAKRLRQEQSNDMQDHRHVTMAGCEPPPREQMPAQETSTNAFAAAKEQVRQKYEKLSMKISPLLQSALVGDLHTIQAWLETPGIDINDVDENGFTLLYAAVEGGSIEVVQAVLAMPRIDVNVIDKNGLSVLSKAVVHGSIEVIQALLAMPGIDVNVTDKKGRGVLYMAILFGSVEVVKALLAMPGIDVNATTEDGVSVLATAVWRGSIEVVQALLAVPGIDVNVTDEDGSTMLHRKVLSGSDAIVQALLACPGIDLTVRDKNGRTALTIAIERKEPLICEAFLAVPGIVVSSDDAGSLSRRAAKKGDLRLLQLIMDRPDFDVNRRIYPDDSYLMSAAKNGHFPIVQALLAVPGIDVNFRGSLGETALLVAARNNHHRIAIVLAAMPGIDVNVRDNREYYRVENSGHTALISAVEEGNLPLVRTLLAVEAINVNLKNDRGYTALMLAAYRGHLEIVRSLLAMPKIDIEAWSDHYPLKNRYQTDWLAYYDKDGWSINSGNDPRFSALSLAKTTGRTQIVEALLAMPVSAGFVHRKLAEYLGGGSSPASMKPGKKSIPTPEESYRFLCQTLRPGSAANLTSASLTPQREQLDPLHASWIDEKCTALSLGTCPASDVPFLLQSTIPFPAWCQSSLANAIALGFTAGHYHNAPDLIWQTVQGTRAWLAGLAFGAGQSRQDAIELEPGICYQLESMHQWKQFLNALEHLRLLKADPDGAVTDKLTLLGRAARDGDLAMIKVLVALGANIHLRSPNGDVPIVAAARAGQWAACAELLSLGAMPVMGDSKGYPALYYIASAFARSDTATPALASLIRYLRLKNVRFDIPAPNPNEQDREKNPTVLVFDTLFSNPESWIRFGKIIYGIGDEPLSALPTLPTPQSQPSASSKAQVHAIVQSADAETAMAAWLDADPQHLHWQDPDNDQTLLHLAAAHQHIGLAQLLLVRGIARTRVDCAGQTAAQILPADYMSSYTPAAQRISDLLR